MEFASGDASKGADQARNAGKKRLTTVPPAILVIYFIGITL
jgi:hypothetical protein